MHCLSLLTIGSFLTVSIVRGSTRRYRHDLSQVGRILGSGCRSGLPRRKNEGRLTCICWETLERRSLACVGGRPVSKSQTYPTIVEIQSAVSAADQDRIIGAPAGGRRAIASNAVSRCQLNKRFRFQPDIHRR